MSITQWLAEHWPTLATAAGIGSGSGLAAKRIADHEQNKRITKLEDELNAIKSDLKVNAALDIAFRAEVNSSIAKIDKRFDRMDDKLDRILENQNKRTI
jgi:ABC-type phosphate transport system auxiliary subunit